MVATQICYFTQDCYFAANYGGACVRAYTKHSVRKFLEVQKPLYTWK